MVQRVTQAVRDLLDRRERPDIQEGRDRGDSRVCPERTVSMLGKEKKVILVK